jgi:hypothetical protein
MRGKKAGLLNPKTFRRHKKQPPVAAPPTDDIVLTPETIGLFLEPTGIVRQIINDGLWGEFIKHIEPIFKKELWGKIRRLPPGAPEAQLQMILNEDTRKYNEALDDFAREHLTLPVALNPASRGVLDAICKGPTSWKSDEFGKPKYYYNCSTHTLIITLEAPPGKIDTIGLWNIVKSFSAETIDVLLILLSYISQLHNLEKDIAVVRLEDIVNWKDERGYQE